MKCKLPRGKVLWYLVLVCYVKRDLSQSFVWVQVISKTEPTPVIIWPDNIPLNMALNGNLTDIILGITIYQEHTKTMSDISMVEVINPEPLILGPFSKSFFFALFWLNLFLGIFYRTLLFYNVWKTGGLFGRPINLLTGNFGTIWLTKLTSNVFIAKNILIIQW